jgi:hypothetical protein
MNTSFDAYLMEEKPTIIPKAQKLSMMRHFELDDDVKEYWGFYLLQDSQVTAIICARYFFIWCKNHLLNLFTGDCSLQPFRCKRNARKRHGPFEILYLCWE